MEATYILTHAVSFHFIVALYLKCRCIVPRKSLSKKIRFEVFKRDSFTCQYCGESAPNVILEVDHIQPVSAGGTNDILNLITSCFDCNRGKGKTELSDGSVVAKQKEQLDSLNERRNQIEMMLIWRDHLSEIDELCITSIVDQFEADTGFQFPKHQKTKFSKLIEKYGFEEVLDVLSISIDQYFKGDTQSAKKAIDYIPRILVVRKKQKDNPTEKKLFYIRGILRNRIYVNENLCLELLKRAVEAGATIESLEKCAKSVKNWTTWREILEDFIEENCDVE